MPRINNPYFPHPNVKCLINGGEKCMCSTSRYLDLPEDTKDCLIQPIKVGRSDAEALAPGKMWTPDTGFMELQDWANRLKLMEEQKKLKEEKEKMEARKAKEARERRRVKTEKKEKYDGKDLRW